MTFEEAICTGPEEVTAVLSVLSEEERAKLAPTALTWFKEWRSAFGSEINGASSQILGRTVTLAVLGTASLSQIKKNRVFGSYDEELVVRVLGDRKPGWLNAWAGWMVEQVPTRWRIIRKLERHGLIDRPDTDHYVLGMIVGTQRLSPLEMLREDPELLREIPHLFRVEGGGESSLAAYDKYRGKDGWTNALLELSRSGEISREELLDRSLHTLSLDFGNFRAGWFSRFHEALKPTQAERTARADAYLRLLQSQNGPTQSLGLKALAKIAAHSELDPGRLSEAMSSVWMNPTKSLSVLGLKLVDKLSEEDQKEHLNQALLHPHPAVVESALAKLRKVAPNPRGDWRRRWLELTDEIPAILRPSWTDWLGEEAVVVPVDARPDLGGVPHFAPIEPTESGAEVCRLASRLLEGSGTAWDIEKCLDGMLRHRGRYPEQKALRKRAAQRLNSRHFIAPLAAVMLAWVGEPAAYPWSIDDSLTGFLHRRLHEIEQLLRSRSESLTLLSLPTHEDGFTTLKAGRESLALQPVDVAQMLLRLRETSSAEAGPDIQKLLDLAFGRSTETSLSKLWPFKKRSLPSVCRMAALEASFHRRSYPWSWEIETRDYTYGGRIYFYHRMSLQVSQAGLNWDRSREEQPLWRRWHSTICPIGRRRWFLRGLVSLANNLDWGEAEWADVVYLEDLSLLAAEWGEVETLLACFGLGCKEPGQFGQAVEQVARALQWGGLRPPALGRGLSKCAGTGMIKMNRWSKAIEELALLVDPGQICEAFGELVANSEEDLSPLLPALAELAARCDYQFSSKVKGGLQRYTGKGKAARAASLLRTRTRV